MFYAHDTLDSKPGEYKNLYNKVLTQANKDTAAFVIQNINNIEIKESPYFWSDIAYTEISKIFNIKLLIDQNNTNRNDDLNEHFRNVNSKLDFNGVYVNCIKTKYKGKRINQINQSKYSNLIKVTCDYIRSLFTFKRESPHSQKDQDNTSSYKPFSIAEVLGRLAYCGFEIVNYKHIGNVTYIISKKKSAPKNSTPPSSKSIVKMERIGMNGKLINIYKIRTMYPYSEYIQEYVVKQNGYNNFGKPNNDFRLLKYGKLIRKLYIDELPQFYNFLKGEINLVGVRPISKFGFNSLPPDLQKERLKFKPGLIPPHIALGLTGWSGVIKAERIFLEEYKKNPLKTKLKYLVLSAFNILTFKAKGD